MTLCRKSVHEFNLLVCEHLDILPTSPTKEQYLQFCNSIIENHNTKFVSKKCKTETQTLKLTKATGWTIYFTELDQPREVAAKAWNELPEDKKEHYKKIAVTQTHERLKEWRHTMSSFEQKTKDEIRNTYNIKNAKDIEFNMKKQDLQENLAFLGKQNNIDASTPVKHLKYLMTCELYNECIARDLYKNKQNYKKYTVPQQHTILPPKPPPPPSSPHTHTHTHTLHRFHLHTHTHTTHTHTHHLHLHHTHTTNTNTNTSTNTSAPTTKATTIT